MAETKTTKKTETASAVEPKKVAPKTTAAKTAKATAPKATAAKTAKTTATKTTVKKAPAKIVEVKAEEKVEVKVAEAKAPVKKAPAKKAAGPMLKIRLVKSASGRLEKQQRTLEALGLHKIGNETVKPDNAQTRGMIFVVKHLVTVESVKEN